MDATLRFSRQVALLVRSSALFITLAHCTGLLASGFTLRTPNTYLTNNRKSLVLISSLAFTYTGYVMYQYKKQQEIRNQAKQLYRNSKKDIRLYNTPTSLGSTAVLAVHGLFGSQELADLCVYSSDNEVGFILPKTPLIAFNFPDAATRFAKTAKEHYLAKKHLTEPLAPTATPEDWEKVRIASLAQEEDIRHLEQEILSTNAQQYQNLILAGVSRGAATIINYMGSKVPPTNIKALILDAPFDAIYDVLFARLKFNNLHLVPLLTTMMDFYGTYYFRNYSTCGIRPIDVVDCIPNMPILMICSLEDVIVPPHNTMRLYRKLIEDGRTNVHLFITKHGAHGRIMYNAQHPEIGLTYRNIVHTFLKTYNLEHDAAWATAGQQAFDACRPSIAYLTKTYGI